MNASRSRMTKSARPRLAALLNGEIVGWVHQAGNGRLWFRYEPAWQNDPDSYPLSLSMPLAAAEHGSRAIRAYLWGLLPDNPDVLAWWARRYEVSRYSVVDLLAHVGEDCAGAVQFAVPGRAPALQGVPTIVEEATSVTWLTPEQLGTRLRDLRINPAAGRAPNDTSQFSLAGAQPKTALYESADGQWGVPAGRMPTNRILKPPTLALDDLAYNEHWCLALARELGMPAAASRVLRVGEEIAIAVERYDRQQRDGALVRIHQEDVCQALAISPADKYEVDGGPGVKQTAELIRRHSSDSIVDVSSFVDAVALNWLIAGTDAHAKNYSILLAPGGQVRLAPLYDLISVLPYPHLTNGNDRLAMSIGQERLIASITAEHWSLEAKRVGIGADAIVQRVAELAEAIPGALERLTGRAHDDDPGVPILARLSEQITKHARSCLERLW